MQKIRVLTNAVRWAKPRVWIKDNCPNAKPLENVPPKKVDFGKAGVLQNG